MKTPFDSLSLACVAHELQPFVGGRIRHIAQPATHQIVLTIFAPGIGEARWLFDCSALWARTHLVKAKSASPPQPFAFGMTLRKYLEDGQIVSIQQRGFDRILDVRVRGLEENEYLLSAELMGKHSNLILISPENRVLHAAKLISSKVNRVRETLPGKEYVAPPAPIRLNPRTVTQAEFLARLQAESLDDFAGSRFNPHAGVGLRCAGCMRFCVAGLWLLQS